MKCKKPVLYGVGVGPGDADLVTLKALNVIRSSDVIAVPKSGRDKSSLALDIIGQAVSIEGKELVELIYPMTKERTSLLEAWEKAALKVYSKLKEGKNVACVTLGDPLFHSTFTYLMDALKDVAPRKNCFRTVIVPGVTSINAASSLAGIPLARGGESIAIIPGTCNEERISQLILDFETIVFIKAYRSVEKIINVLERHGYDNYDIFFVSRAGLPGEFITSRIDTLKGQHLDYFSIIIIKRRTLV